MSILKSKMVPEKFSDRPQSLGEARRLIQSVYDAAGNEWDERDQEVNCEMLGIDFVRLSVMPKESVKVILDDFEKRGMIIFKK